MSLNLTESEYKRILETLWENGITGMALLNKDGYFIHANPQFCGITEYSEPELKRLKFQDITDPRDVKADEEMSRDVIKGESEGYVMNKRYITKKGKVIWVLLKVKPIEYNGNFEYFLSQISTALEIDNNKAEFQEIKKISDLPSKVLVMAFVKKNWTVIMTVIGALGLIIAEVIKSLKGIK